MRSLGCRLTVAGFVAIAVAAPAQITFELSQERLTTPALAVFLAGSFNDWSATATTMSLALGGTTWRAAVTLPDGRHYYKFLWRDGAGQSQRINDPSNPFLADDGRCGANNFVDVRGGVRVMATEGPGAV